MNTHKHSDYAALLLRLALGTMFLAHGLLKVTVFTLPGTVQFFESIGFPGMLAYLVTAAEIAGGIMLILGLATRWVALALLPILLGAVKVHFGAGWEYPAFLAVAAIVQALLGPGALALRLTRAEAQRPVTA